MPDIITADSLFRIGETHRVCQDYAHHHVSADGCSAFASLSDGCSTALSPNFVEGKQQVYTDFGARLMVLSSQRNGPDDLDLVVPEAVKSIKALGLGLDVLSCTLIEVFNRYNDIVVNVSGDGWIAARQRHDGKWTLIQVVFPSGAPYYPRYGVDQLDYNAYVKCYGSEYEARGWVGWQLGTPLPDPVVSPNDLNERDEYQFRYEQFVFPITDFDLVVGMSDFPESFGVLQTSATSKQVVAVPLADVFSVLLGSIAGVGGEFLKRALFGPSGAVRQFAQRGWVHHDDMSLIALAHRYSS